MINYELMAETIQDQANFNGRVAIVLGSGLGPFADNLQDQTIIPYDIIPGYPKSTVEGHSGELVVGSFNETELIAAKGRFHYYEGYEFDEITIPIHVFSKLGVDHLIITNSSGSMDINAPPGTLMAITGHMDCTYRHSADDPNLYQGLPYHDPDLIVLAKSSSEKLGFKLATGNYCWTLGPAYETPAEIKDMQRMSGHAVGMSTVPEIIAGGELGMKILTISCLTNYASGISPHKLTHEEVMETANKSGERFTKLLKEIIASLLL
jgi:purine-nucleoside phosphorylase